MRGGIKSQKFLGKNILGRKSSKCEGPEKVAWTTVAGTAKIPVWLERMCDRRRVGDEIRGEQIRQNLIDQEKGFGLSWLT